MLFECLEGSKDVDYNVYHSLARDPECVDIIL